MSVSCSSLSLELWLHLFVFSCHIEIRKQRYEHSAIQLLATSVLAAELHGCLHVVVAIRRWKRWVCALLLLVRCSLQADAYVTLSVLLHGERLGYLQSDTVFESLDNWINTLTLLLDCYLKSCSSVITSVLLFVGCSYWNAGQHSQHLFRRWAADRRWWHFRRLVHFYTSFQTSQRIGLNFKIAWLYVLL